MNVVYEINRYWVTENVTIINKHFSRFLTIFSSRIESYLVTAVVKEGSMAPFQNGAMLPSLEPKWGHTALPGGQYGPILSQIAKMGPYCPPWRAVWPHPPAWSKEGKGG